MIEGCGPEEDPARGSGGVRIGELLRRGTVELTAAGVSDAVTDIQLLLGYCLNKSRTQLYLAAGEKVVGADVRRFLELLERRKRREPVAYILGEREFWSLPFHVTPDVLIPRPETEFLLEQVLKRIRTTAPPSGALLDLCCGSGVIAIVLALELKRQVFASDISMAALGVARRNAERHGVQGLIDFIRADLLAPVLPKNGFSVIVSNPPYVSGAEMRGGMQPEVIGYEPHLALSGGDEGLDIIRRIRRALPFVLCRGGYFWMEIGEAQGRAVQEMFSGGDGPHDSFDLVEIVADYAGKDRVLCARLTK